MCLGSNLSLDEIFVYKIFKLKNTYVNETLGVIVDRELKFDKRVKHISKNADNKLNALTRMANILNPFQKNTLFKSFIKGQFGYCSLLWMFCSRSSNNLINKIHERALSLTSKINHIPFNELTSINNDKSNTKNKNTQTLLIEVYMNLNGLSPRIMLDLFTARENIYNLRNFRELYCEKKKTIRYGTETVIHKTAQLWELLPYDIENSPTLMEFKERIKTWSPDYCPCRLSKMYPTNIGYIDIANTFSMT